MSRAAALVLLLVILMTCHGSSRSMKENSNLISDVLGIFPQVIQPTTLELDLGATRVITCEPTYGFLPFKTELWGQLFLLVVLRVLAALSEQYISSVSNLFFEMFGTGIFGAWHFPSSDTGFFLLLWFSGVSGDSKTVETMATMGVALLAGSAIFPLTIIWGCYGVETDTETKYTAGIMLVSVIPFLILQLEKVINSSTGTLNAGPSFSRYHLSHLFSSSATGFVRLFCKIDKNKYSYISSDELRALILGIQIEEVGLDEDDFEAKVMEEFDISGDSNINENEFVKGLSEWLTKKTSEEHQSLSRRKESKKNKPWWNILKAAFLVSLGTAVTVLLAQPLMQSLQEFSTAANIPSFLVSYVVIPLALGFRQALRTVTSTRQKTEKVVSLTFSEICCGMSRLMFICTAMGLFPSFSTKFPFWTSIVEYLLYPISLLLLYIFTGVVGWSKLHHTFGFVRLEIIKRS
ncbi:hypothetical protein ACOSQ3_012125 [Xanthoceras sorbifolium]